MKKENEINNLFEMVDLNNSSINNSSINNPPFSSSFLKENPKNIKQILNDNNSSKNDDLLPVLNILNEQSSPKENKANNLNIIYNNLKEKQSIINNEIMENIKTIEKLKNSLSKLKSEKNDKKLEVVNFLSNKESLDEIYNNYMDYLKNKKRENKGKYKKYKNSKPNPFENQDEDTFEILISEIKEIDVNKFIEQTFNFVEEIFDNPSQQMKLSLKDIIDKSYSQFNKEISISQFLDTYSIVSNFFLRISIFLSNESNGKYSETIINLFLRCLLKMNSINVKNEKLINYMNTKYKEEKEKLKEEIYLLEQKNEILNKNKILLQNQIKDIDWQIHIEKNKEYFKMNENNYNINKVEKEENNAYLNNDLIESNKKIKINNGISQPKNKKSEIKEKFKLINRFQKVYKEDIIENNLNCNDVSVNYDKSIIIKDNNKVINENDIRNYNKILYENFNKINSNNSKYIFNKGINEPKNKNIFNLNNKSSNNNHSNKIFNSIKKKEEEYEKKEIPIPFMKKIENTNIKKYNTINYHEMSKIYNYNSQKEYISPEFDNKKISYFKEKEINKNIKEKSYKKKPDIKDKENNFNQKLIQRIYYNRKVKGVLPQKKKLNYHYISNNFNNNNIISLREINKNMKFDLVKKINYLEKVNTNFNLQLKNIPHNNKIFDDQSMRLLTEKKEKSFKYNFFDIFQETNNKKRNNSGDNNHKKVNNLNKSNHNNILLRSTNEKAHKTSHKIYDYIIKTDYINNKTKSFYKSDNIFFNTINNSNRKEIKNGIEIEIPHNGSDSSNNQFELSFPKKHKIIYDNRSKIKTKNFNEINKNKKELNIYNNKNISLNDRNKCYHYNKNSYNNSGHKKVNNSNSKFSGCKCQSLRKERNINNIINKDIKKNNIYFIITESRNNPKANKFLNKNKNENTIEKNSKSKSKRGNINKNRNYDKEYNSYTKSKKKISNFNNKFNNAIFLKRSVSSTLNKLLNKNLPKKPIIDSTFENKNNNNSYSNNSFASNPLGVSVSNGKKKVKEIVSYNDKKKKSKIIKVPISNLKVGLNNNSYNNINNNSEHKIKYKLNYKEKFLYKNIVKDEYYNLIKKFKNQKETFCYFKIFEEDTKNKNRFNPLENCSINPENIGYCEGYISIDNISNYIKILPKKSSNPKYNNKNNVSGTEIMSNYNININNFLKKDKIKYGYNLYNKIKDSNLNIKLKDIYEIEVTNTMNNIIKIHNIFLKYNSIQKNNINDIKDLNLNKFIYMREMQEINIPQNEKIKSILCNYFSFSFVFEKYNQLTDIELIFINFEQYNLWNSFIKSLVSINSKNKMNKKDEFPDRKSINSSIDFTHIKGSMINGSSINEDISKISSKDVINV